MAKPMVELHLDGQRHSGWTEIEIQLGLQQVADRFTLTLTEKWAEQSTPRPIRPDSPCKVTIDGKAVITGYVDEVLPSYDNTTHSLVVSGRSKTADLVDCSQRRKTWSQPRKLEQIASELAKPFGIEVVVEADTGAPLRAPAVEAGQPLYEALAQMARYRGVILVSNAQGQLVITKPPRGRVQTALALGQNIRTGSGRFSVRERFSQIIIQGQQPGDDFSFGEVAATPEGVASDTGIRHRPQVILADTSVDSAGCRQRANAEVRRRNGQGRGVTYTLADWTHRDGLWQPGYLVPVNDPWLGIEADRLIEAIQLRLDERGIRSEIRVVPPSAWDLTAEPEPEQEQSLWG